MRNHFYSAFLLLCFLSSRAQDTTKILFIGNSFTYGNNMPQMVKAFADAAQLPVYIAMHAPGGVSVGDIAQGNMAHMNNPVLFSLIRSKLWDFVVIQDNQGRFVRDSGQFSPTSLVVQGHLNIRDSVKANNQCAKVILFGGWAWKYGSPPYGNTGIECIQRILCNYRVLNDTMKEVVAPIGEAWIRAFKYLPSVNLWDTDDAHPSYAGSYLTASLIFSTLFEFPAKPLNYSGTLPLADAYKLRAYADSSLFNASEAHAKYNLCGVKEITPQAINNVVSVGGIYTSYQWHQNNVPFSTGSTLNSPPNGLYSAWLTEPDGCLVKSCYYSFVATATGIASTGKRKMLTIYPLPAKEGFFMLGLPSKNILKINMYDLSGASLAFSTEPVQAETKVSVNGLQPGCYLLEVFSTEGVYRQKIMVGE